MEYVENKYFKNMALLKGVDLLELNEIPSNKILITINIMLQYLIKHGHIFVIVRVM